MTASGVSGSDASSSALPMHGKRSRWVVVILLSVLAVIQGLAVTHGDSTLGDALLRSRLVLVQYVLIGLSVPFIARGNAEVSALLTVPIAYWLVVNLDSYGGVQISSVLTTLCLLLFCFLERGVQLDVYRVYRYWIGAMCAVGIICYLSFRVGGPLPYREVAYYANANIGFRYMDYGVSYVYGSLVSDHWRLCGLFNEPGYFGTITGLILCAEGMDFKKPLNVVMLAAGLLTFSAAFVVVVLVGLLIVKTKTLKSTVVLALIMFVTAFVVLYLADNILEVHRLLERFGILEGTAVLGDRDTPLARIYAAEMLANDRLLFGYGGGFIASVAPSGSSFVRIFVDYGLIGTLLMYAPLMAMALLRAEGNRYALALILVFALSIYQRPPVFTVPYFVVLFGGIENAKFVGRQAIRFRDGAPGGEGRRKGGR